MFHMGYTEELANYLKFCPWRQPRDAYAYLYISDDKLVDLLKIVDGFSTFAEIWSDLQYIDKEKWHLNGHTIQNSKNPICFKIMGHGFLVRENASRVN